MAPTSNINMEASNLGPRKRKAPVNNNGEAVNIPKNKKLKAAAGAALSAQPAAHTLSMSTLKKQAKSKRKAHTSSRC